MKCQRCDKVATFHITELIGNIEELHLCEDCAREYLTKAEAKDEQSGTTLAGSLASQLPLGQTAADLARLDQEACPVCGITFLEFRNQGRLGCPHDYVRFGNELEPLLMNIHGETEHQGKKPRRRPGDTDDLTEVIRLRREMKEAVNDENYERASELRDKIRQVEELEKGPPSP